MYTIYFDMDGTIADLYGVADWLPKLRAEDEAPYLEAELLVNSGDFQLLVSILQNRGFKIGIISWLAKNSSKSYDKKVRQAKKDWLIEKFPEIVFDEVHIVKYGTRKDYIAKDKNGLIFDDDERVREKWRGESINPNLIDIIEKLQQIKEMTD